MQPEQQQRIMGYFIEEAKDHLNTIEQGLLNLQSTIDDPDSVNEVFRAAHSVKGGAAMLGLTSIQKTAHRLEDYFKILKEAPGVRPDQKIESLLLQVFDTLQELLDHLQSPGGLDEATSNAAIAKVEPVFEQLSQHFTALEQKSTQPEHATVIQGTAAQDSTLLVIFQNDVPAQLREMLQLFRQAETSMDGRDRLLDLCRALRGLGDAFNLQGWASLLETTERAIANPDNAYRTLAPIVIKELKQGQDLVLAGRPQEIQSSAQLQALAPTEVSTEIDSDLADFFAVADGAPLAEELDLSGFDFAASDTPALDLTGFDLAEEAAELDLGDFALTTPAETSAETLDLDGMFELPETDDQALDDLFSDRKGPEVGMDELNSLADLFEGETPDLGTTWQAEEVIATPAAASSTLSLGDDGELSELFNPAGSQSTDGHGDDLSSLFDDELLGSFDGATPKPAIDAFEIPDFDGIVSKDGVAGVELESPAELLNSSDPADIAAEGDFSDLSLDDFNELSAELEADDVSIAGAELEEAASFDNLGELFAGLDENELNFDAPEVGSADSGNGNGNGDGNGEDHLSELDFTSILTTEESATTDLSLEDDLASLADEAADLELEQLDDLFSEPQSAIATDLPIDLSASSIADPWGEPEDPLADLEFDASAAVSELLSDLPETAEEATPSDLDALFDSNDAEAETLELSTSDSLPAESLDDLLATDLLDTDDLTGDLTGEASNDLELHDLLSSPETSYESAVSATSEGEAMAAEAELDDLFADSDAIDLALTDANALEDQDLGASDLLDLTETGADESLKLDDLLSPDSSDDLAVSLDQIGAADALSPSLEGLDDLFEVEENLEDSPTLITDESAELDDLDLQLGETPVESDLGEPTVDAIADLSELDLNFDAETDETSDSADALLLGLDTADELDLNLNETEPSADDLLFGLDETEDSQALDELDLALAIDTPTDLGNNLLETTDSVADLGELALNFDEAIEPTLSTDEFSDLEDLLSSEESQPEPELNGLAAAGIAATAIAGLGAVLATQKTEDDFADLDNLLDTEADSVSADDFGDLDALLDEAPAPNEAATEDFSDLESLLADAPEAAPQTGLLSGSEPDAEFDDLEKMLEETDKTMGGTPAAKVRTAAPTNRRVARPSKGLSEQTMRVPVKHLDNLSNLVGELVVNRNSLEQDQERLRQSLDNLLYQVQQLSDVGQRMQDLYERSLLESSLLASRQNHRSPFGTSDRINRETSPTGVEYDPLEMDRFTGFHSLSQEMIELIVRVRESSSDIEFIVDETEQVTRMFRQVTTQLQEGLTRSRMVPFAQTADRLPRAVRDIALKCGKQAELVIEGRDTLIDKMILEHLYDPVTHLVNNAITHGIEAPEVRIAAGKAPTGQITIRAFHQGNQTVISVSDDGAGIDVERVRSKAIEKGLITAADAQTLSRLDIYDLLFHPGFSTKDQADDFSGRGVGMDVVRTSLSEIRGTITTDSVQGKGTNFTIRLPLTLSISKALCCISDRARIAFPMDGVEDMLDLPKERIQTNAEGQPTVTWRDTVLTLRPLNDLLSHNRHLSRGTVYGTNQEDDMVSVVVLRSAGNYLALQVDQVLGEQEIVIKQLEGPVPKPIGIAGATVLGDGRIMPIADVLELIDLSMGRIRREVGTMWEQGAVQSPVETVTTKTEPMVLIVDDSITVRELLSMTFNKVGYRVEQARDGQEAWEKLRAGLPCDLVFCDIEMPRMDGLELLSRIQKDPNLSQLPIAMLTSRGADRHRQMAVSLGASGYFTKPYLEEALLDAAQRMLKGEVLINSSSKDNH
jgi:chemosensory pili system protein ChpA (sensor histidine kinase/response regulator)